MSLGEIIPLRSPAVRNDSIQLMKERLKKRLTKKFLVFLSAK